MASQVETHYSPLSIATMPLAGWFESSHGLLRQVVLAGRPPDGPWTDNISGSEQQRLALARCLVARPEVIFADEPTRRSP